ncbi:MAG: methionine-R-sulfoxide reductase, partial [Planctomycetota bacterium]
MSKNKDRAGKEFLVAILVLGAVVYGGLRRKPSARSRRSQALADTLVIDDFSPNTSNSAIRPEWVLISDQGKGAKNMQIGPHQGRDTLHMTGDVSLENNGSFIQASTNLHPGGKTFDASSFAGIYLRAKGNGQSYAIHLQTGHTRGPRQYYQGRFQTDRTWQDIKIDFGSFKPVSVGGSLESRYLKTVAIATITKQTEADIYVDEIGFYKEQIMYKKLTPEEQRVILHKGTEKAFSGKFNDHYEEGTYTCKQCGAKLFESTSKFKSNCGWPSFDDQKSGAVKLQPDVDGIRTEIVCQRCGGHLGHVFMGEGYTPKNTRYCVNSVSLDFDPARVARTETAIFASGCFWGTQY